MTTVGLRRPYHGGKKVGTGCTVLHWLSLRMRSLRMVNLAPGKSSLLCGVVQQVLA